MVRFGYAAALIAAALIALAGAVFIAMLLWRRDNIASAAYWAFALLLAVPLALLILQVTDIITPSGPVGVHVKDLRDDTRREVNKLELALTDLQAQLTAELAKKRGETKTETETETPRWVLVGEAGDCSGHDISRTEGSTPDVSFCT